MPTSQCRRTRLYLCVGVLMGLAWPVVDVRADDVAPPPETLGNVVVTSEKTAQPIEHVPASVSSLSGHFIRDSGATSFEDLQDYTANATISLSPDSGQFSIRGFTTPDSNAGFDPSVGTVVDGVYYGRSEFLSAFFYDIGNFQVLRGPQGTLFGKNTSAGLFELNTAEPLAQPLLRSEYLMTDDGDRSFRPVVQTSLGPYASLRAAANIEHGDRGVLYNTDLNRGERNTNQDSGRVRVRFTPTDALLIDLEGFVSTQRRHNNIFQLSKVTPAMAALFRQYDPNVEFSADNNLNSANLPSENVDDVRGASATVEYDFSPSWEKTHSSVTLISAFAQGRTSQLDIDADFSPVPFIADTLTEPSVYRQLSEELRFNGQAPDVFGFGHEVTYVTGLYFARSTFGISNRFAIQNLPAALQYLLAANTGNGNTQLPPALGGPLGGLLGNGVTQAALNAAANLLQTGNIVGEQSAISGLSQVDGTYAGYGQLQWFIVPHWAFIGGLRLGLEHKTGHASSMATGGAVKLVPLISDQRDFAQDLSQLNRDISPKVGVQWSPNDHSSAYLTWTVGYKSGGFNAISLNPDNLDYGPERASSYELGYKTLTQLWNTPLRFSGDLYWTDFKNLQVSTLHNATFEILNAAAARSRGFETDIDWLPFPHASLHLSAGLADAVYTSYPNAPATVESGQTTQDLTGRPLAFAPRWSAALIPGYTVPLPYAIQAHGYLDVLFRSGRYLDIDDDALNKYQRATTLLNARVVIDDPSGLWSLSLAAHNLTDVVVLDQVVNEPLAVGNFAAVRIDRGLSYSADITFSFGRGRGAG